MSNCKNSKKKIIKQLITYDEMRTKVDPSNISRMILAGRVNKAPG